ncbi:MAG: hypothetical protein KatS3mg111_1319 [Pirellulaceae bacterium]|nr:MAG: hypothetical protein KatS3mg111_1319 [Pirellulaceae bacterium]
MHHLAGGNKWLGYRYVAIWYVVSLPLPQDIRIVVLSSQWRRRPGSVEAGRAARTAVPAQHST